MSETRTQKVPNKLFVGGLPYHLSDEDLHNFFETKFGDVKNAIIILDGEQRSRGFGFVTFAKNESYKAAIEQGEMESTFDIPGIGKRKVKIEVRGAVQSEKRKQSATRSLTRNQSENRLNSRRSRHQHNSNSNNPQRLLTHDPNQAPQQQYTRNHQDGQQDGQDSTNNEVTTPVAAPTVAKVYSCPTDADATNSLSGAIRYKRPVRANRSTLEEHSESIATESRTPVVHHIRLDDDGMEAVEIT